MEAKGAVVSTQNDTKVALMASIMSRAVEIKRPAKGWYESAFSLEQFSEIIGNSWSMELREINRAEVVASVETQAMQLSTVDAMSAFGSRVTKDVDRLYKVFRNTIKGTATNKLIVRVSAQSVAKSLKALKEYAKTNGVLDPKDVNEAQALGALRPHFTEALRASGKLDDGTVCTVEGPARQRAFDKQKQVAGTSVIGLPQF